MAGEADPFGFDVEALIGDSEAIVADNISRPTSLSRASAMGINSALTLYGSVLVGRFDEEGLDRLQSITVRMRAAHHVTCHEDEVANVSLNGADVDLINAALHAEFGDIQEERIALPKCYQLNTAFIRARITTAFRELNENFIAAGGPPRPKYKKIFSQ